MFLSRSWLTWSHCVVLGGVVASAPTPARPLDWQRAVEPAPAIYASGPTRTGRTREVHLPTVVQVDALCRAAMGGLPAGAGRGAYYWGCYHERWDLVVLVDPKAWPSRREWNATREHEWAHARGWRHPSTGRGTDWERSLPPTAAAAPAVMVAMAEPESRPASAD